MKISIEGNPDKRLTSQELAAKRGPGFAYHESSQPIYRVKVLIRNLDTEPEIYVSSREQKIYKIPALIDFLDTIEQGNRGNAKIHGGAIAKSADQGILISGWQDIGKTSLVLYLSQRGYSILGDDNVILSRAGDIIRVQSRAGIYPHPGNLNPLPLKPSERFMGWLRFNFSRIPAVSPILNPNQKVDYNRIGSVLDSAKLSKIYILEVGEPGVIPIDTKTTIRKLLATSLDLFVAEGFPKRLFYSYCFANDMQPDFVECMTRKILESALAGKPAFLIRGRDYRDFRRLFLEYENR